MKTNVAETTMIFESITIHLLVLSTLFKLPQWYVYLVSIHFIPLEVRDLVSILMCEAVKLTISFLNDLWWMYFNRLDPKTVSYRLVLPNQLSFSRFQVFNYNHKSYCKHNIYKICHNAFQYSHWIMIWLQCKTVYSTSLNHCKENSANLNACQVPNGRTQSTLVTEQCNDPSWLHDNDDNNSSRNIQVNSIPTVSARIHISVIPSWTGMKRRILNFWVDT